jgi:hypothetical protein
VWAFGAQRGVVAVAGIDHGGIVIYVEHTAADVVEQLREVATLPRLPDATGEQRGAKKSSLAPSGHRRFDRSPRQACIEHWHMREVARSIAV